MGMRDDDDDRYEKKKKPKKSYDDSDDEYERRDKKKKEKKKYDDSGIHRPAEVFDGASGQGAHGYLAASMACTRPSPPSIPRPHSLAPHLSLMRANPLP